jgi:hypothetical protein
MMQQMLISVKDEKDKKAASTETLPLTASVTITPVDMKKANRQHVNNRTAVKDVVSAIDVIVPETPDAVGGLYQDIVIRQSKTAFLTAHEAPPNRSEPIGPLELCVSTSSARETPKAILKQAATALDEVLAEFEKQVLDYMKQQSN